MAYTQILQDTFDNRLESGTLDRLRSVAKITNYEKGTVLCHQGEVENTFYILVEGQVLSTQKMEDGETRMLGMLGPNEYFGEMGLIDDRPRMSSCKAMKDVTVLEITGEVFETLVAESPAVAYALTQTVMKTIRQLDELSLQDMHEKNLALEKAYTELKEAQANLVEKERMEREIELASNVQRSLLPENLPQYPDYGIAAYLKPARQVGGDFYDAIEIDDENIGLLIADVADKGIHAAMFMAVTRTLFYTEGRLSLSPSEVALHVHKGMLEVAPTTDVFVTAFYGVLNRPTGNFTYVRAGHEVPFLCRQGQPVDQLPGKGRFLGMLEDLELEEYSFQFQPEDRLILYSDGVPDAMNHFEKQYGNERFIESLKDCGKLSASEIVNHIVDDVASFCEGAPPFDDLTLLVLEVK